MNGLSSVNPYPHKNSAAPVNTSPSTSPKDFSIFSDKKFLSERTVLAKNIEATVLKKLNERQRSPFQVTDTAAIRDLARVQSLSIEDATDLFLISSIKVNIERIQQELFKLGTSEILISQASELAELLLNESATNPGQYRDILLDALK